MVKDSLLVSVVWGLDITSLGMVTADGNVRDLEKFSVVALIYLTLTIILSLALRWLEQRLRQRTSHDR